MSDQFSKPPQDSENLESRPGALDVVLIDGRWGQLKSSYVGHPVLVMWLDKPGEGTSVDLKQYTLAKRIRGTVADIKDRFTDEEISRINWTSEQTESDPRKLKVAVFGEYVKKQE